MTLRDRLVGSANDANVAGPSLLFVITLIWTYPPLPTPLRLPQPGSVLTNTSNQTCPYGSG